MSWPAVLLWIVMIGAVASNGPALLYVMTIVGVFGSLQMLPGSGGVNLLPQSACAVLLIGKVLVQRGNIIRGIDAAIDPQRLALFSAFVVYSVFGSFLLPRVFAGMFEVVPVSAFRYGTDILKPSAGNITQSCYMVLSFAAALVFTIIGTSKTAQDHYRRAVLYAAFALIASGVLDIVCYTLHIQALLDPFRTASYALLTDVEAAGAKRVVGLMTEASSFGASCVASLASMLFLRPLYKGIEHSLAVIAILMLAVLSVMSTSSTAFVGLGVMGVVYGCDLLMRLLDPAHPRRAQIDIEITIIFIAVFLIFAAFVVKPDLYDPIITLVDKMVFNKTSSASYIERSLWNRVGWHAFLDSGGLGAGLGSVRVSNWTISILGSTGVFGAVLMFGFIFQQLVTIPRQAPPAVRNLSTVLKLSAVPSLVMYQLSGTIPDIGVMTGAVFGMIAAGHAFLGHSSGMKHSAAVSAEVDCAESKTV